MYEYDTTVNKGSLNMRSFGNDLNDRAKDGWRLHTVLEQEGNTICVFERQKN